MLSRRGAEALNSEKMQLMQAFEKMYRQDMQHEAGVITTPSAIYIVSYLSRPFVSTGEIFEQTEVKPYANPNDLQVTVIEQLDFLIKKIGLNISQLADLLKVGRQSIYKWRDGTDIRRENLHRLDNLYIVFRSWNNKFPTKLGSYLYKKIAGQLSLYDLLVSDTIDVEKAKNVAIKINRILLDAGNRAEKRRKKLQDAGFTPASQEQKNKVLNNLIRKS